MSNDSKIQTLGTKSSDSKDPVIFIYTSATQLTESASQPPVNGAHPTSTHLSNPPQSKEHESPAPDTQLLVSKQCDPDRQTQLDGGENDVEYSKSPNVSVIINAMNNSNSLNNISRNVKTSFSGNRSSKDQIVTATVESGQKRSSDSLKSPTFLTKQTHLNLNSIRKQFSYNQQSSVEEKQISSKFLTSSKQPNDSSSSKIRMRSSKSEMSVSQCGLTCDNDRPTVLPRSKMYSQDLLEAPPLPSRKHMHPYEQPPVPAKPSNPPAIRPPPPPPPDTLDSNTSQNSSNHDVSRIRPAPPTLTNLSHKKAPPSYEETLKSYLKTATLPPLNMRTAEFPIEQKSSTLPVRRYVPHPDVKKEDQLVIIDDTYDGLVYVKPELSTDARLQEVEKTQISLSTSLQKKHSEILDEIKKLSTSVEHLKIWTKNSQDLLESGTISSHDSVESLKRKSQDVTRQLREHIIQMNRDVSSSSAILLKDTQESHPREHRVINVFDWGIKLLGDKRKSHGQIVNSHGHTIKELNYMVTAVAQHTKDGNVYIKLTGQSRPGDNVAARMSGNFSCQVCVTDMSDTMPDWTVGKVFGNLFTDNEWVVGTIASSELIAKGYCQEGHVFKLKFALEIYT